MMDAPEPKRFQPSVWDIIAKLIFYTHLILIAAYSTVLIVSHRYIVTFTLTFITVIIYGYMIVWVAIINLLLLCFNRVSWSVCLVRIGIKLVIALCPVFTLVSYFAENWLYLRPLVWFMTYLLVFSVMYVFYEISAYFCCQRTNPDWIYRVSRQDLADIRDSVTRRRREFLLNNA